MSKSLEMQFKYWTLTYNGIVPTGDSDYSSEEAYVAVIYYETKLNGQKVIAHDREVFNLRSRALAWIDKELA